MQYTTFVKGIRAAYEHRGGIKTLRLGTLDPSWFTEIQREASSIIQTSGSSDVTQTTHFTNWTRPTGEVRQFSLFNNSGRSEDYHGDYGYRGDASKKRLVFPHLTNLKRFAALFGSSLRNLRLNGMGKGSGLSLHEENSIEPHTRGANYIVRFHLPVFTTPDAFIYLDNERFRYAEGDIYFFNHGCVHAAENKGTLPRYHLVLDCFLDRTLFRNLFPGTPSPDPGFRKSPPGEDAVPAEPFKFKEFVCEDGHTITQGIEYGRRAPTLLDFYKRNYPSAFALLGGRRKTVTDRP